MATVREGRKDDSGVCVTQAILQEDNVRGLVQPVAIQGVENELFSSIQRHRLD
jgi:hypothetical protein